MKTKIAFALIMGIITTGIISFTLISINLGFTAGFFRIWLKSWGLAYVVVIPAILIIAPRIQKLVDAFFSEKQKSH
jgi:LytS/YehU family sensor histidine kinase